MRKGRMDETMHTDDTHAHTIKIIFKYSVGVSASENSQRKSQKFHKCESG